MLNESSGILKIILSILLFPLYFQSQFIAFAWGADEAFWIMTGKRVFLLLPVLVIILGCWITIACAISILFRHNRMAFISSMFITWWDLGKSIVSFWGGIVKFAFIFIIALLNVIKIVLLGAWYVIQEILFAPFRLLGNLGTRVISSNIPWIAVVLTIFWCFIEATIFTYVTTPLVIDTFSNITGEQLSEFVIRIPLFVFLLFIVLGSYAVLSTLVDSAKSKKVSSLAGIIVIEIVVLFVEVMFLYREFVDALSPWLAQQSENFELGIFWTLVISAFAWFGIRSVSWFLFAAHGTPAIMAVIQGKGLKLKEANDKVAVKVPPIEFSSDFMKKIKADTAWIEEKGEEILGAFILPPLQVLAAAINFFTLLISGNHLFELPFKKVADIMDSKVLLNAAPAKPKTTRAKKA
ncbi:MAG TPA: hypothetical protein ENO27_04780 [Caldithrix sp.]|nr:hypothetical protein [Calditrichaceae bacterium]HEM49507.1 hypothetical protein [Caldithrix sp.]HES59932.1 hypothetical protein [Caldithrix sp.]